MIGGKWKEPEAFLYSCVRLRGAVDLEQCSGSLLCEHKHFSNFVALDLDGAWVTDNLWGSYFVSTNLILKESVYHHQQMYFMT